MSSFSDRFIQQGLEQGLEQGEQLGMRRGEARVLLNLLKLKFGEVPQAIIDQVEGADADTLLRWSGQILTAKAIEEVFDG